MLPPTRPILLVPAFHVVHGLLNIEALSSFSMFISYCAAASPPTVFEGIHKAHRCRRGQIFIPYCTVH
ncbi:hypothetical protein P154DRAFT_351339 [Amniculicola lignicola CBS 123094]|uniref:Uncharacterized protein n=1 Tax=Amniculicola lignicola CBS 123094 TaxID=1392246 RepID=A0A6A5WU21_9PLEO|nr:hypothetical protein P154DRAFT_351339 [Amniculicola lignicola CBS 123094]